MDSSQRGAWASPKKPVTQATSMPNWNTKWNPNLKRGEKILFHSGRWGKGEKLPDLFWNAEVPGGSDPSGPWTPYPLRTISITMKEEALLFAAHLIMQQAT